MTMARILATYDCETDPFDEHLYDINPDIPDIRAFLWCYHDYRETRFFDTAREFVEFVRPKHVDLYAHNGGKFDAIFLAPWFHAPQYHTMINGRLVKVKLSPTCTLHDSYALYPVPLKDTGQKGSIELWKLRRDNRANHSEEIKRYCAQDCIALRNMLLTYRVEMGNGLTLAGCAFRAMKKISDYDPQSTPDEDARIRPFYFGGRTEVFTPSMRAGVMLDINSAYPWAMRHGHPAQCGEAEKVDSLQRDGAGFYLLESESIGAFPWRDESGSLRFPCDGKRRQFKVSNWELTAALKAYPELDHKIVYGWHYARLQDFSKFVDHFFAKKQSAPPNSIERQIAKLILNSPYGKLGMNVADHDERVLLPVYTYPARRKGESRERWEEWDTAATIGRVIEWTRPKLIDENTRFVNVAAAASITGMVRARLWEAMRKCKGVAYCDTDSIFCRSHNLKLSDRLGDFSLQGKIREFHAGGKKLYCVKLDTGEWKLKSKGKKLSLSEIIDVCVKGKEITFDGRASIFSASIISGFTWRKKTIKRTK